MRGREGEREREREREKKKRLSCPQWLLFFRFKGDPLTAYVVIPIEKCKENFFRVATH